MLAPLAALIAEKFSVEVRYTGASMGYQVSSILAGGFAPLIAAYGHGYGHVMATFGRPASRTTALVLDAVRAAIMTGELSPGEQVRQQVWAEQCG